MPNDTLDPVETLAKVGATLVGVQIEAASISAQAIAADAFVFGYCFGLFEAMAQMAGLEQYSQGAAMIEAGFARLVDQPDAGPALFRRGLDMQVDADFLEGAGAGAADLAAWAADANALPTGIAKRASARDDARGRRV